MRRGCGSGPQPATGDTRRGCRASLSGRHATRSAGRSARSPSSRMGTGATGAPRAVRRSSGDVAKGPRFHTNAEAASEQRRRHARSRPRQHPEVDRVRYRPSEPNRGTEAGMRCILANAQGPGPQHRRAKELERLSQARDRPADGISHGFCGGVEEYLRAPEQRQRLTCFALHHRCVPHLRRSPHV